MPPNSPISNADSLLLLALAISGGVDSMALAFLCAQTKKYHPFLKISDNPVSQFLGLIIDHKLRDGSRAEAEAVRKVLINKMKMRAEIQPLKWRDSFGVEIANPSALPNLETQARRLRYRRLGLSMYFRRIGSVFFAHHEDDQYETVLMRLMLGHGYRGLRGMLAEQDIPECQDMHGVYQSGFVDDQLDRDPFYNMVPTKHSKRAVRDELRGEIDQAILAQEIMQGARADLDWSYVGDEAGERTPKWAPPLSTMTIEDGGTKVYRPLLEFPKDRLIATCLENDIPWFEDHTNTDPTFTTRNTLRYLARNHQLPVALQKPSILELAARCKQRVGQEEAEAERWLSRMTVRDFEPNAGTVVIQMPEFALPRASRTYLRCSVRRKKRLEHYRAIANVLFRKLISMVTPEAVITLPNYLDVVSLLCPSLSDDGADKRPPKAFTSNGVYFIPLIGDHPVRWYLCRAPHVDKASPAKEQPTVTYPFRPIRKRWHLEVRQWKMSDWYRWGLFDGRYWVRIRHRFPCRISIAPFKVEHYKSFKEALGSRDARKDLERRLRRYAPGKVRWTLPAIYAHQDVTQIMQKNDYWPDELKYDGKQDSGTSHYMKQMCQKRMVWENEHKKQTNPILLALPTLGVQVPGLHDWLRAQFRYRKVDSDMLEKSGDTAVWEALFQQEFPPPTARSAWRAKKRAMPTASRPGRVFDRASRGVRRQRTK